MPRSISCSIILSMLCSLCFVAFFLKMFMSFVWTSFSHSSCIPHASYPCSYLLFFPSFLLIHLSICDKKGESIPVCFVIYIWLMCTFVGQENHRGDAYTKGEKTFLLCFLFLFFLWCFDMLCCSHCIMFMCWTCIHPYAIVLYWLHVQMIICFAIWSL